MVNEAKVRETPEARKPTERLRVRRRHVSARERRKPFPTKIGHIGHQHCYGRLGSQHPKDHTNESQSTERLEST